MVEEGADEARNGEAAAGRARARPRPLRGTEAPTLADTLARLKRRLDQTRLDIDNSNPNHAMIEFHVKQRWADEINDISLTLQALITEQTSGGSGT